MRTSLLLASLVVLAGLGCAKKKPAGEPVAEVCRHVVELCGKNANFEMCVASARAMRANDLEAAKESERCVLEKKSCQDATLCAMKPRKPVVRTSLRNAKEKVEKVKEQLSSPATPTPAPAPAEPTAK